MKVSALFAAASFGILSALTGCQKQAEPVEKGPAEQVGAKIDDAAEKIRPALNKAGEKIGEVLQKGGQKLEEASKDAQKKD